MTASGQVQLQAARAAAFATAFPRQGGASASAPAPPRRLTEVSRELARRRRWVGAVGVAPLSRGLGEARREEVLRRPCRRRCPPAARPRSRPRSAARRSRGNAWAARAARGPRASRCGNGGRGLAATSGATTSPPSRPRGWCRRRAGGAEGGPWRRRPSPRSRSPRSRCRSRRAPRRCCCCRSRCGASRGGGAGPGRRWCGRRRLALSALSAVSPQRLTFTGRCRLRCLHGSARVLGFAVTPEQPAYDLFSPLTHCALSVEALRRAGPARPRTRARKEARAALRDHGVPRGELCASPGRPRGSHLCRHPRLLLGAARGPRPLLWCWAPMGLLQGRV